MYVSSCSFGALYFCVVEIPHIRLFPVAAFFMPLLPSLTLPLVYWSLARPKQDWQMSCRLVEKEETLYKDESRSFDIGNVPVLEAPFILTLYPTIPNNRCPLRYRCEGMLSRFFLLF